MFKIITIALITLYFLFQLFLNILSYKNRNAPIPQELSDVYDEKTYLKWKEYCAEKVILSIVSDALNYILTIVLILTDVLSLVVNGIENEYLSCIVVLLIFIGSSSILGIITGYINTMKVEQKYGFNRSSLATFIGDQIKSLILSLLLLIGLACLLIVFYNLIGDYILIVMTAIVFLFTLFISFLYPLFSKIFNKFVPLEEGELRTNLENMLKSHGYGVRDIKVMDASRRTTKSNAYFTGFGKSKTIVLYDNLLKHNTPNQIVAIFAHEMAHGLHKDTLKNSIQSLFSILIYVALIWAVIKFPKIYYDFGFNFLNYGFAMILAMNTLIPIASVLLGIIFSFRSRKAEYKADEQSVKEGYGQDLIDALKILARENFSDLNPHPLIVLLEYSHPTLLQRVRHIKECMNK